eukprot:TRINITY_DN3804_c2_g1_i2.p1 TRINITY_DN3804_c2_g1~~TRINITY_DN3804_c2_g1_i2.p1  ORF type:complete len:397 (+),score=53.46 TRINITY_DN3804_c2_g1_i2:109-1191(+)
MPPTTHKNVRTAGAKATVRPFAGSVRPVVARAATLEVQAAADPEAEVDPSDMSEMYKQFESMLDLTSTRFEPKQIVRGTVITADRRGALIDIGAKGAAWAPTAELSCTAIQDANEVVQPGMSRDFEITHEDKHEVIYLSMARPQRKILWQRVRQMQEEDVTVDGTVVTANRGGVVVEIFNVRGFCPNTHLGSQTVQKDDMIGQTLPVKFLDVDESTGRIMLSARRAAATDSLINYKIGDVVEGVVSKVAPYGAFVEVSPGVVGLLHISQISHDRVSQIEKIVDVGDKLKVMIMSHDRERGRLALSTKKIEPTPGDMLKDPSIVYARAEEMAKLFKIRVAAAEEAAREEEARLAMASTDQA